MLFLERFFGFKLVLSDVIHVVAVAFHSCVRGRRAECHPRREQPDEANSDGKTETRPQGILLPRYVGLASHSGVYILKKSLIFFLKRLIDPIKKG